MDEVIWRSPPRPWAQDARDAMFGWLRAHGISPGPVEPPVAVTAGDDGLLLHVKMFTGGQAVVDYAADPPQHLTPTRTVPLLLAPPFTDTPPSTPRALPSCDSEPVTRYQLGGYDAAQINANHREAAAVRPGWALNRVVAVGEEFLARIMHRRAGVYLYVDLTELWVGPADDTEDAKGIGYLRRYPGDSHGRLVVTR